MTLSSVIEEVYSILLLKRLNTWMENNNVLPDEINGFRSKRSTEDNAFILLKLYRTLMNLFLSPFSTYTKRFTVSRPLLSLKLSQMGLSSRALNAIKSLYENLQTRIATGDGTSSP